MNDCFESVRLIQRYYNRAGIFQMDYSITYQLAFSLIEVGLYTGKILAPNLTSHTIMALLSRTSLTPVNTIRLYHTILSYVLLCCNQTDHLRINEFERGCMELIVSCGRVFKLSISVKYLYIAI